MKTNHAELKAPPRYRQELRDVLVAHAATYAPAPTRPMRQRTRKVAPAAIGTVMVAAVIALLVGLGIGGGGGATSPQLASAASFLRASARALELGAPEKPLAAGEFDYTKILERARNTNTTDSRFPYLYIGVEQRWIAANGSGRDVYRVLSAESLTPWGKRPVRDRSLPGVASRNEQLTASARPFPLLWGGPTGLDSVSYAEIRRLPVDPTRLAKRIDSSLDRMRTPLFPDIRISRTQARAAATFIIIRGLAQAPAPRALLAGFYRVLAQTPGLQLTRGAKDAVGRTGTEISVRIGSVRLAMVVDPATGALLEVRRSLLFRSSQFPGAPGMLNQATYLAHAVVRSDRG